MNRAEFMNRLTALLTDVSPTEREEAIQYYNDYFCFNAIIHIIISKLKNIIHKK